MAQFFKEVARQRGNDALYEENYDKIFGKKEEIVVNQETSQEEVTEASLNEEAKKEKELIILDLELLSQELYSLPEVEFQNISLYDLRLFEESVRFQVGLIKKYLNK